MDTAGEDTIVQRGPLYVDRLCSRPLPRGPGTLALPRGVGIGTRSGRTLIFGVLCSLQSWLPMASGFHTRIADVLIRYICLVDKPPNAGQLPVPTRLDTP